MNSKFGAISILFLLGFELGCSSSPKESHIEYAPDVVLGRSDERSSRPDWVNETVSTRETNGVIQFIGMAEVPGDSRIQASFKMSDSAARGMIAGKIETNVTKIVENSESGLSMEDQSLRSLIHEVSQVSLSDIDIKDRYWEKIKRTSSTGDQSIVLKAFSRIDVDKTLMQKLILDQAKKSAAPKDLKNKVEEIVRSQWMGSEVAQ